jgi:hypothetical protein
VTNIAVKADISDGVVVSDMQSADWPAVKAIYLDVSRRASRRSRLKRQLGHSGSESFAAWASDRASRKRNDRMGGIKRGVSTQSLAPVWLRSVFTSRRAAGDAEWAALCWND